MIFSLILLYWLEALALLRNWKIHVAKVQKIIVICFLIAFICSALGLLGYLTHSFVSAPFVQRTDAIYVARKLFIVALIITMIIVTIACACCVVGIVIFWRRKEFHNAAAVLKSLVLYLVILLALAIRGTFLFDNGFASISTDQFGWNFSFATVFADALIITSLVTFSVLAIYASEARAMVAAKLRWIQQENRFWKTMFPRSTNCK